MKFSILKSETDEILALNKPAGLIVHSDGRTHEPSLADWILQEYPDLANVGEPWISPQGERVLLAGIVHRLDRGTSGIVLVAKNPEMYAYLKNEFKERRIEKVYRAFVYGHMEQKEGKIIAEIARSSEPPRRWYAKQCDENNKRAAITEWKLLKCMFDPQAGEPVSYIEIRPKTGRTHQIRVHFASVLHPIVADHLYAPECASLFGFDRPALHAFRISFKLPSGERQTFTAPLPSDFEYAARSV